MMIINDVKLAKELIKFPSITPIDSGVMKFLEKKLKKLGFKTKIIEFKEKNLKPFKKTKFLFCWTFGCCTSREYKKLVSKSF